MATNSTQQTQTTKEKVQSFAFVIAILICFLFSIGFVAPVFSQFGQPCEIKLDGKINPNDAPLVSLLRLPGIGLAKASAIVTYRENFLRQEPNNLPFETPEDLQKVKGIGPKTVESISEWLKFE